VYTISAIAPTNLSEVLVVLQSFHKKFLDSTYCTKITTVSFCVMVDLFFFSIPIFYITKFETVAA
jgi:hypothetical protein